jgi:hypothetical protein
MELEHIYQLLMPRLAASANLEKQASDEALTTKAATDTVTLGLLKTAASPLMKGLLTGAGVAIPATAAGSYLIHRAGREGRKTTEDIKKKAIQAALGVAAIGGGLYALHRARASDAPPAAPAPVIIAAPPTTPAAPADAAAPVAPAEVKTSAANESCDALLEKLATVGFLDVLFEDQQCTSDDDATRTKAAECQLLNAEHGVDLLRQLLA